MFSYHPGKYVEVIRQMRDINNSQYKLTTASKLGNDTGMLVKVNNMDIDKNKVRVSKLDIDDYGSIITIKELEPKLPANDNSIIQKLQNSSYATIFTKGY
jgi:hypothetical protein